MRELLALHQPAAGDLRFMTTAMKIVTDLERVGDQAVNTAQRVLDLNQEPQLKPYIDLPRMAERAQAMVKDSLVRTPVTKSSPRRHHRVASPA